MNEKQENEQTEKTELLSDLVVSEDANQTTAGTAASGGGGGAGKVSMRDFSFTMKVAY